MWNPSDLHAKRWGQFDLDYEQIEDMDKMSPSLKFNNTECE